MSEDPGSECGSDIVSEPAFPLNCSAPSIRASTQSVVDSMHDFTNMVTVLALVAGTAFTAQAQNAHPAAQMDHAPPPVAGGIWKAVVPARKMHGEFDNFDPMGLAAGAMIPADCSLNWVSPDTGKLYCFVSGTSLVYFLQSPGTKLRDAEASWISLRKTRR